MMDFVFRLGRHEKESDLSMENKILKTFILEICNFYIEVLDVLEEWEIKKLQVNLFIIYI